MDITFESGDALKPRGHALVYFRDRLDANKIYASYVIVLPVVVDFAKYIPPFLASHMGNMPMSDFSAFSLPPMPEEVKSLQDLEHLAAIRQDDLLFAGTTSSPDVPEIMEAVGEVVRHYAQLWSDFIDSDTSVRPETPALSGSGSHS